MALFKKKEKFINQPAPSSNMPQNQAPTNQVQQNSPANQTNMVNAAYPGQNAANMNAYQGQAQQQVPGQNVPGQQPQAPKPATTEKGHVSLMEFITGKKQKGPKVPAWKYIVMNDMNKKETGVIEATDESEVKNFLVSQGLQLVSIFPRGAGDIDIVIGGISPQDLAFSLTQLSTYIKSGIPLADSVSILAKQATKKVLKQSFTQLHFELIQGENFSAALEKQDKYYPGLLINMVKTAEMTGDLPTILDDMAEYYTSMDQTRKQMRSAMIYPSVVLTIAIGVLIFMLTYLVPQFSSMFAENGGELPFLTRTVLSVSKFLVGHWLTILLSIVFIIVTFIVLFKRVPKFKKAIQIALMHIPVIKNIIIYNEISNFTKTFASLLNHGVFITDSMAILQKITNNEVYKEVINNCLANLAKGETVSSAFKGQWAVPVVAYEMIVTGERTGQLGAMMEKVASHFQAMHKTIIDQMKSLVEPILIVFLAVVVGIILLSIIEPMFAIYDTVK